MAQRFGTTCLTLFAALAMARTVSAVTIWSGPPLEFSKAPFADPSLEENQDRLTDDVWITRDVTRGLFNAAVETFQSSASPAGTMWAVGTTDELGTLTFGTWLDVFGLTGPFGGPPFAVGNDFVLHLVDNDIFVDLHLDAWGQGGGAGGTFTYTRSTIPEPSTLLLLSLAALGLLNHRGESSRGREARS